MSDSIYAKVINTELGSEPIEASVPAIVKGGVQALSKRFLPADLGRVHEESYRGVRFVVREKGSLSFNCAPTRNCDYWTVFFSDEELLNENGPMDFEARIQACRNAIERAEANTPMYPPEKWWKRGMYI